MTTTPPMSIDHQPTAAEPAPSGRHSHWHVAFIVAVMLGSVGLFIRYVVKNVGANYYDESYYVVVAERILKGGLWGLREDLRTYLYPLLLAFAKLLFGSSPASKILISIFQYVVFLYALRLAATTSVKVTGNRAAGYFVFAAGALNPYLVQSTTLFLTDILAACLVACAFVKLLFGDLKLRKDCLWATLPFSAAAMVRPASAVFIPIALLGLVVRRLVEPIRLRPVLVGFALSLAFFVPQLHMNVAQFRHWTPMIHVSLYQLQSHEAVRCLKYGTVVIPGEAPPLCSTNSLTPKPFQSMQELAVKAPLAFSLTAAMHAFGAIDWGYIDAYITDYYPKGRLAASLLLHTTWFLAAVGFVRFLRRRRNLPPGSSAMLLFLAAAVVMDLGFLATTQVESRFGYPVFLMALPFLGFALARPWPSRKATVGIAAAWLLWVGISAALSFWIDATTGRIHWLAHLW